MSTLDDITPEVTSLMESVLTRVPGSTAELVAQQVGDAMGEFFQNSCAWSEPMSVNTIPGTFEYVLAAPDEATPCWVLKAFLGQRPLGLPALPYPSTIQAQLEPPLDTVQNPMQLQCPSPGIIQVLPRPTETVRIDLLVAFKPISVRAALPPHLVAVHRDAIMDGTLLRLYSMPGTPSGSTKLAEFYGRKFRTGMSSARETVRRSYTSGLQPVMPFPTPAGRLIR